MVMPVCPLCGQSIVVEEIHRYIVTYGVNHSTGRLLKSTRRRLRGEPEPTYRARCSDAKCGASWSSDEFEFSLDKKFVDKKYCMMPSLYYNTGGSSNNS